MKKFTLLLLIPMLYTGCNPTENKEITSDVSQEKDNLATMIDSLMYFRQTYQQTDLLSRYKPDLGMEEAYAIQKLILEEELKKGHTIAGYKMGGTVTTVESEFKPMFGFILDKNIVENDSTVSVKNFPGGSTMVEGEVGFILGKDFPNGVETMDELKAGIQSIVGGVEFAKPLAIAPENNEAAFSTNHVIATGLAQAGTMKGSVGAAVEGFDFENEIVQCYINDTLAAEGNGGKIFGTPLNALFWLANELPKHGLSLQSGMVVITGGLYQNPIIDGPADVRLEFTTLGTIRFKAGE